MNDKGHIKIFFQKNVQMFEYGNHEGERKVKTENKLTQHEINFSISC